jgi:hypothetical protein
MRNNRRRALNAVRAGVVVGTVLGALIVPSAVSAAPWNDWDWDGLPNRYERNVTHTNPFRWDTDRDRIPDGFEDLDEDGLINLVERRLGTDPLNPDTDGDGLGDALDDMDCDRLSALDEMFLTRTNPRRADTDNDDVLDVDEDPDRDGISNGDEVMEGTNPRRRDTDRDRIPDGADADANGDGVDDDSDADEDRALVDDPSCGDDGGDDDPYPDQPES